MSTNSALASHTQLGAYIGIPGDPAAQAQYNSFVAYMGQAPTLFDCYVDQSIPESQWISNAQWAADTMAGASWSAGGTPVVGIPMAAPGENPDSSFRAISSGSEDAIFNGMFQAFAGDGFSTFYIRPGWEMNGGWENWSVTPSNVADFNAAFQHIANLAHSFSGASIQVVWNPNVGSIPTSLANFYPGNSAVDVIGLDTYGAPVDSGDPPGNTSTDPSQLTLLDTLALAKANGKPFALPETGGIDPTFSQALASTIAQSGAQVAFVNLWDISDESGSLSWTNSGDNQAAGAAWKQAFQTIAGSSQAAPPPVTTPPVTTPPAAPSPDGTKITTAAAGPIIDKAGNAWKLVQSTSNGLQIAVNGTVDTSTSNVVLLETLGGNIVQENTAGNWYSEPGPGGAWTQVTAPVTTPPVTTPPVTTPPATPSPDGTKITTAAAGPIIDKAGNTWKLVQSTSNGLQIAVNGTVDTSTSNVVLLETLGGNIVQENTAGNWYSEPGPGGAWTQVTAPVTTPPPPVTNPAAVTTGTGSDTLVLSISEDAYQGNAQFTVSVDGKQLAGTFATTASHASGATQSFTFKGDWAAGAHAVAVNFLNDANGGTAATDRNLYVNAITYDGKATGLSAELAATGAKSFSVTDATAIPAAAIGSGSDTLVLNVSEDAYQGNAQFTVSVDGKQLGGTFTATALHSAAASQNFTFKGDFGTGAHAVAVNFLNDAWGGTAATDRNLYVNGITYNGAATGQSAVLGVTGPQNFSVTGGTTPSVSETGDHGSLAKTLSQTGSYTVGGDTFVLTAGNAAAVTLGTGTSQIKFIGANSATLTGGSGQATVTADAGSNKFVAGTGTLDVTGGGGKDAYVFHANGGLLKLEDFSIAKGDTLTVDKALQGAMQQTSDGQGGTMLTFGAGASHGVDIHGLAVMPTTSVLWA